MPTPPAATRLWKSMSLSVTTLRGVIPSNVAALMMRFRSVTGPSFAGANGSRTAAIGRIRARRALGRLVGTGAAQRLGEACGGRDQRAAGDGGTAEPRRREVLGRLLLAAEHLRRAGERARIAQ